MLTVAGLSKSFGGRELFDDVSLTLQSGERVAIVGPNGAGKSTLFKIILGKEEADAGDVTFIRGTRIGYLPQESEPAGNETVLEIAVPHEHEHDGQFVAKAKQILDSLGFKHDGSSSPGARNVRRLDHARASGAVARGRTGPACCSTSRRTISISKRCSGFRIICAIIPARFCSSRTTANF